MTLLARSDKTVDDLSPPNKESINTFLALFQRERDFYAAATSKIAAICEKVIEDNAIRAIVTSRVKRIDRLSDKLERRAKKKDYSSIEKIRADIPDLGGIRIALYFPGDQERVCSLISQNFTIVSQKKFPETISSADMVDKPYRQRFEGYRAIHFRVSMKSDQLSVQDNFYADAVIEIQIGSVLMHAWAEVEHDLIYKPLSGEVSVDEFAILDELNGLVHAGEIALERLQRVIENRVRKSTSIIQNQYELNFFLYDYVKEKTAEHVKNIRFIPGQVGLLYELSEGIGGMTPQQFRAIMDNIEKIESTGSIADQVIAKLIDQNPVAAKLFEEIISRRRNSAFHSSVKDDSSLSVRISIRWAEIINIMKHRADGKPSISNQEIDLNHEDTFRYEDLLLAQKKINGAMHNEIRRARTDVLTLKTLKRQDRDGNFLISLNTRLLEIRKKLIDDRYSAERRLRDNP